MPSGSSAAGRHVWPWVSTAHGSAGLVVGHTGASSSATSVAPGPVNVLLLNVLLLYMVGAR